mmetsp:Transcript_48952/g.113455  ORF Transcript_48952/g.113455 Transcript_48952/m.113455 type:complete len:232 (+) Transcript_48952:1213-1908(+)
MSAAAKVASLSCGFVTPNGCAAVPTPAYGENRLSTRSSPLPEALPQRHPPFSGRSPANLTVNGAAMPASPFPLRFSTIHRACCSSANRTSAALSVLPGVSGRTLHCCTTPYWPKISRMESSVVSMGSPAMKRLSCEPFPPLPQQRPPFTAAVPGELGTHDGLPAAPLHVVASYLPLAGFSLHSNITGAPESRTCPSDNWLRCTKTSGPPLSGVMKPKPLSSIQVFTLPGSA